MSNVTYSAGNLTITVAGLDTVEQALGDLKRKTPAAAKVAINATARQARKLMVAKAKTRYAVNAAGRRHPERPCAAQESQQQQLAGGAAHSQNAQRPWLF